MAKTIKTTKHILNKWVDKHLSTHSDWTGTRVETIDNCDSLDNFLESLWNYLEEESNKI